VWGMARVAKWVALVLDRNASDLASLARDQNSTTPLCYNPLCLIPFRVQNRRMATMCAERMYWRCHRGLVSDYLLANGISAPDIPPMSISPGAKCHYLRFA
jgi:hypothetical protein